jgi:hypothetical protein
VHLSISEYICIYLSISEILKPVSVRVPYCAEPASAAALTTRLGGEVDVVFAADCIFQTLFGDAMPLLEVLLQLCSERTVVLLATERRPNDGIDAFVAAAEEKFSVDVVKIIKSTGGGEFGEGIGDVVLHELRMLPPR